MNLSMSRPLSTVVNLTLPILSFELLEIAFNVASSHAAKAPIKVSRGL